MTSLRTLALASTFGLLMAGTASAFTASPIQPADETGIAYYANGSWSADDRLATGRSVAEDADHHPMHHYQKLHHHHRQHHRVHANGFCNGVSHGTGDRTCGTATGGPVGGNPSRN